MSGVDDTYSKVQGMGAGGTGSKDSGVGQVLREPGACPGLSEHLPQPQGGPRDCHSKRGNEVQKDIVRVLLRCVI